MDIRYVYNARLGPDRWPASQCGLSSLREVYMFAARARPLSRSGAGSKTPKIHINMAGSLVRFSQSLLQASCLDVVIPLEPHPDQSACAHSKWAEEPASHLSRLEYQPLTHEVCPRNPESPKRELIHDGNLDVISRIQSHHSSDGSPGAECAGGKGGHRRSLSQGGGWDATGSLCRQSRCCCLSRVDSLGRRERGVGLDAVCH